MVEREDVLDALREVVDPELGKDVVEAGMISDLDVSGGRVSLSLVLTTPACPLRNELEQGVREAAGSVEGVKEVEVDVTSDVQSPEEEPPLPGVKNVVAVASGKGGVGKSTVAVNLAAALSRAGADVGLLDADIHGPNVPRMLGVSGKPEATPDGKMAPKLSDGIRVMSMGFLVDEEDAAVWRGPMLMKVLDQLLEDVDWGRLDYLLVDLPPGTGDVPLSLIQNVPLAGAVLVTTPERVAVESAVKSISLFGGQDVPILGVVENMSGFRCPGCGDEHDIFGSGGGEHVSERFDVDLLARIPIDPEISSGSDGGAPVATGDSAAGERFRDLAEEVASRISVANSSSET